MTQATPVEQIAERGERLLLRHEELQRTNALLVAQVGDLFTCVICLIPALPITTPRFKN